MIVADQRPSVALIFVIWEAGSLYDGLCNEMQNKPNDIQPALFGMTMNGTLDRTVHSGMNVSSVLNTTAAEAFKLPSNGSTS